MQFCALKRKGNSNNDAWKRGHLKIWNEGKEREDEEGEKKKKMKAWESWRKRKVNKSKKKGEKRESQIDKERNILRDNKTGREKHAGLRERRRKLKCSLVPTLTSSFSSSEEGLVNTGYCNGKNHYDLLGKWEDHIKPKLTSYLLITFYLT